MEQPFDVRVYYISQSKVDDDFRVAGIDGNVIRCLQPAMDDLGEECNVGHVVLVAVREFTPFSCVFSRD